MVLAIRLLVYGGVCATALLVLASCRSANQKRTEEAAPLRRMNLVLVTIDTLRADRLGCYGANVETPHLDKLAQRGVLFENAIAQAPLTAPSHASMFTGLYPAVHKVRDTGGFILPSQHTTLAEVLQAHGWDTAAFVGASVLKQRFGFNQGFAVYDDEMDASGTASEAPERRAVMHVVGRRATLSLGAKWGDQTPRTQLVVIGSAGGVDAAMLQALFDACRASEVARAGADPLQHALNWVRRNWPQQYG